MFDKIHKKTYSDNPNTKMSELFTDIKESAARALGEKPVAKRNGYSTDLVVTELVEKKMEVHRHLNSNTLEDRKGGRKEVLFVCL